MLPWVLTPAARCGYPRASAGIYGLRPTHGRISVAGMMIQAPSFDTVGYFTRDAMTFGRVGAVLLGEQATDVLPPRSSLRPTVLRSPTSRYGAPCSRSSISCAMPVARHRVTFS